MNVGQSVDRRFVCLAARCNGKQKIVNETEKDRRTVPPPSLLVVFAAVAVTTNVM